MLLKALTINWPFSEFIISGLKEVENRPTKYKYKGLLLVHSSMIPDEAWHEKCSIESFQMGLKHINKSVIASKGFGSQVIGSLVGAVIITDVCKSYDSPWSISGQYQLVLDSPIRFKKPVPCPGKQSFWMPKSSTIDNICVDDMSLIKNLYNYSKKELGIEYYL